MKEKLLVVDSIDQDRLVLRKVLYEYDVITAVDGREMWQVLEKEQPSLILLNVVMPGEDVLKIAKELSQDEDSQDIPIIFITAKDTPREVEEGLDLEGGDYIKKPFDERKLKAIIKAILHKKYVELQLRDTSNTDPLTKLYNRRYFLDVVNKRIEYITKHKIHLSISIIEINSLQEIRDAHGDQVADSILKELANSLNTNIRPYDLVARYGGGEFVVLFFDCSKKNSKKVLKRIRKNAKRTADNAGNSKIQFTFSAGISEIDDIKSSDVTLRRLLKIANERLHIAKQAGGNQIIDSD